MPLNNNALGQSAVNVQPAIGIAGDWASANPRHMVLAGPGGLVAGVGGVICGRFCWAVNPADGDGAPALVYNTGFGLPTGILHRGQLGLITTFLASSSNVVQQGQPIDLVDFGDLFMNNDGATQALPGMKAFAQYADGKAKFKAAGTTPAGTGVATASIAASTSQVVGSIVDDVLIVTAVNSGVVRPGTTLSGSGVATGTKVVSQLTGTAGGIGTYAVSIAEQAVAAGTTINGTYGTMTVTVAPASPFIVGGVISGTGVAAGTILTQFITGTGGTGTYAVDNNTVVASTADIAETLEIETKWFARSSGLAGEVVKVSAQAQG